ncbi:MAG: hypothetical protein ACRDZN_16905, partial [Acidimicrobiales bacterium]
VALAVAQLGALATHSAGDGASGRGSGLAAVPAVLHAEGPAARDLGAYAGHGAWVDVYDLGSPGRSGGPPAEVTLDDLDGMAAAGVRTVYLQAAQDDGTGDPGVLDAETIGAFLVRAHQLGLRVVGWYLPRLSDVHRDLAHLRSVADFAVLGHRFDGVAVDIEWTDGVIDPAERSERLVELSSRLRDQVGGDALGAIVLPPVQTDVVNPGLWPGFPWSELAALYDVWLPMVYWTERRADSGYRDGAAYTGENVARLRDHLGDADAAVHPIGGIGDEATAADLAGYVAQLDATGAIGGSVYDWATLDAGKRSQLAAALGP